jgi:hypothetical protein
VKAFPLADLLLLSAEGKGLLSFADHHLLGALLLGDPLPADLLLGDPLLQSDVRDRLSFGVHPLAGLHLGDLRLQLGGKDHLSLVGDPLPSLLSGGENAAPLPRDGEEDTRPLVALPDGFLLAPDLGHHTGEGTPAIVRLLEEGLSLLETDRLLVGALPHQGLLAGEKLDPLLQSADLLHQFAIKGVLLLLSNIDRRSPLLASPAEAAAAPLRSLINSPLRLSKRSVQERRTHLLLLLLWRANQMRS